MNVERRTGRLAVATLVFCLAVGGAASRGAGIEPTGKDMMQLSSTAFAAGAPIPAKYTCEGTNFSPPLKWSGVPASAKSLALIVDDPDAPGGTWVHWVVFDLAASVSELPEGASRSKPMAGGAQQGVNSFRRSGYGGPCPPPGNAHRYFFKLYALDTTLELQPNAVKKDVERAMEKHILAQAELMGTHQRE